MPRPLTVLSSPAVRPWLDDVIACRDESDESGDPVNVNTVSGALALDAMARGADASADDLPAFDAAVFTRDVIQRACTLGYLDAASRCAVACSGIAVAVPDTVSPESFPDISTQTGVHLALTRAGRIALSAGPSGRHLTQCFALWGWDKTLEGRLVIAPPGTPVAELLRTGLADLGFQQASELIHAPGIRVVGDVPGALQTITVFEAAMVRSCRFPARAARLLRLLQYLGGAQARARLARHGLLRADATPS